MHVPISSHRGAGDPRPPTPDRCRSARQQTNALDPSRPVCCGCFFPESGGTGDRHWLSSNQRQSSVGTANGFSCSGPGKVRRGDPGRPRVSRELRDLGVAHEPATATKNQTECHLEMDVLTTASAESLSCEGCLRHRPGKPKQRCRLPLRASIEGLLCGDPGSRPTCHFELHRARQPLRWPMAAEFGQPGNFHPTLQISLSPHGTGEDQKLHYRPQSIMPTWVSRKRRGMRPVEGFWHARR